jgi:hypothetical protein
MRALERRGVAGFCGVRFGVAGSVGLGLDDGLKGVRLGFVSILRRFRGDEMSSPSASDRSLSFSNKL